MGDFVRRGHGLSDRESSLLAHLDELAPVTAGALARHLGIGASTLTAAIDRLAARDLVERTRRGRRRRAARCCTSAGGREASLA
jgi:DNA-binding MarR family transcriptional regulator